METSPIPSGSRYADKPVASRSRLLACVALLVAFPLMTGATHAENLNQKFGPEWNCSRIGQGRAELDALRKACLVCEQKRQDFFQTGAGTGNCVARTASLRPSSEKPAKLPTSSSTAARPVAAPKQLWCAIAAGIEQSFNTQQVSVGVGNNLGTKQLAEGEALANCSEGGFIGCEVKHSWNRGCGYVTTGSNGSQVGWAMGASVEELDQECMASGLACKQPIGCCAEDEDTRLLKDLLEEDLL